MNVYDLNGAIGLIVLVGGGYAGLYALMRSVVKPIKDRLEQMDKKMVSRKSVQTILAMHTREVVGLKRKVMPTINVLKVFLASKGIKISPKNGEYVGDLSRLSEMSEDDFVDEIRILLDSDNDEE